MGFFKRRNSSEPNTTEIVEESVNSKANFSNQEDYETANVEDERFDSKTGLKRGLKDRHISLIALAGIIGPGILIGAGQTLASGGPLALLLAVIIIGLLAFAVMLSLGEMLSIYPAGGGFTTLAKRFHSDSLSAVVGYNYVIVWFCVLSNEYNTLSSIMGFWDTDNKVPLYGYILLFWIFFEAMQLLGVGAFGETEYWLALVKIIGLCAFYIFAIVYISGGIPNRPAFGFQYWNDPGAIYGFKGFVSVLVYFSTFFSGIESISATTNEAKNPRVAIPRAVRQTVIRIFFVYFLIALFYGVTVPSNDPNLSSSERVLKSPISIAIVRAGWANGTHLVNVFILVTCLSAVNSSIYIGSRTITNLASEGLAPKFLAWKDKRGVPIFAITLMNLLGLLSLMNISTGAGNAYSYIVNISGVAVFIVWGIISATHLRVRKAWKLQNFDLKQLPFRSRFFPWFAYLSLFFNILFGLIQGWWTFKPFDAADFVDAYVLLPFGLLLYAGIGFIKGFKLVDLNTVDLDEGRRKDLDWSDEDAENSKKSWFRRAFDIF